MRDGKVMDAGCQELKRNSSCILQYPDDETLIKSQDALCGGQRKSNVFEKSPKKISVERRRRFYLSQDVPTILAGCIQKSIHFHLRYFDDHTFSTRTILELLSMDVCIAHLFQKLISRRKLENFRTACFTELGRESERTSVDPKAFLVSSSPIPCYVYCTRQLAWIPGFALGYNSESGQWRIQTRLPGNADLASATYESDFYRVHVHFTVEDALLFKNRLMGAIKRYESSIYFLVHIVLSSTDLCFNISNYNSLIEETEPIG
jgi:hypothetical protein